MNAGEEKQHVIKTFQSKKGNTVVIRYPVESDFDAMWGFACDLAAEDTYVAFNQAPSEEEERAWFSDMMTMITNKKAIYLVAEVNGVFGGNARVLVGKFRHAHGGQVGIALAPAFRNEGIGRVLLDTLIDEAKKHGLRLLTLSCFEGSG